MSETAASGDILSIKNVSKTFAGTRVLDRVSLDISRGEVHALLGQNGSGKSTLIKILSGYHAPDGDPDTSISVRGESVRLPMAPTGLRRFGVAFMHQDLGLVDTLSVLENLRVGRFTTAPGRRIRWRSEVARARELFRRFDLALDPRAPVSELSQAQRAVVGLIRALQDIHGTHDAGLLVLDEPTVSLSLEDVEILFDAVRRIARSGSSVLFVSHKLEEVLAISDRVSVLRDGRLVSTRGIEGLNQRELASLIIGRDLGEMYPPRQHTTAGVVMTVRSLSGSVVEDLSFEARRGEILGLTGLVGAGHDEVPYLIYGARKARGGSVEVNGSGVLRLAPERCKAAGIGLLPADRHRHGAIMGATVRENVTAASLGSYGSPLRLRHRTERSAVRHLLDVFDVRPAQTERTFALLSGGNQQKALLARWISLKPQVLMLHEPTQGVDVSARKGIFEILQAAAKDGMAVVYASAEYEDLSQVCDRVLVFRDGGIAAELVGDSLTESDILAHCYVAHDRGSGESADTATLGTPRG